MSVVIIAATTPGGGIGESGKLPWTITEDMKRFKKLTTGPLPAGKKNAVVMGRGTFESVNSHPLPNRINVVLSTTKPPAAAGELRFLPSLEAALENLRADAEVQDIFIAGGKRVYEEAMRHADFVHLTRVVMPEAEPPCDVVVPCLGKLCCIGADRLERRLSVGSSASGSGSPAAPQPQQPQQQQQQQQQHPSDSDRAGVGKDGDSGGSSSAAVGSPAQSPAKRFKAKDGGARAAPRTQLEVDAETETAAFQFVSVSKTFSTAPPPPPLGAAAAAPTGTPTEARVAPITYDYLLLERRASGEEDKSRGGAAGAKAADGGVNELLRDRLLTNLRDFAPHEELQYLNLIRSAFSKGNTFADRTGVGCISFFGAMMRFDLRTHFPLLTTKRVFFRGVVEELAWFLRGCTDNAALVRKDVHIWDANASRTFLDNRGLQHYRDGDLGPVYGFQWRHFGAEYKGCDHDYSGEGVDQLQEILGHLNKHAEALRSDEIPKHNRRLVMSAWNPTDIPKMALPPCHLLAQFFIANGVLSCLMYQRSADIGLGVPFNIASYALLTVVLAKVTGLQPGEFIHATGDTHVYTNHVTALEGQAKRVPCPFPRLTILDSLKSVEDLSMEHLQLHDYFPQKAIKMEMAV
eukprot:GHVU01102448.1.p1 GENE.GHVU01102448.1~~GHVU01102448.1.p1  ORF type:complete len:633 (-),score=145.58 GHVU01102448.1:226-2124(-)